MRENRGITLIALVVTIVVLLILAGVSISMLTGENGIITQAQESKIETRGGAVEEARDLWKTNQKADSFTDTSTAQTLDEVLTDLVDKDLLTEEERDEVEETGKVTIGSREIVFFEEMEDYDEYILEQIDENKIKIEILFLEKINEIISEELNSKTDEELFMLSINSNMTFQEFMKNIYEQGNIDTIYTSLKDWYLSMGMPEKEYEQNINFMKEDLQNDILENDIKIINPDGTIYSNSYIIPFETGEYIFSIQFLNQIYKIKVTIDEFEIMREGYNHIYLYS